MNNYILNSGYCSYRNTYNYIETNNHYACPYVFMTNDDVELKYVYFMSMPPDSGSGTMGFKDPDGNEQMGPIAVYYTVKAWGVATIKEAAEIGGITSDSSLLIIKNSLGNYNCQLKDTTTIEYDSNSLCINYKDIKKYEITNAYFNILFNPYGMSSTTYVSVLAEEGQKTTDYNLNTNTLRIKLNFNKNHATDDKNCLFSNFKHRRGLEIVTVDYNIILISEFSKSAGSGYSFINDYTYTKGSTIGFTLYNQYGLPTRTTVNSVTSYDQNKLQILADDVNLILEKVNEGYFDDTGSGTESDPYILYLKIIGVI